MIEVSLPLHWWMAVIILSGVGVAAILERLLRFWYDEG